MTIRGPLAIVLVAIAALSLAANFAILGYAAARMTGGDGRGGRAVERIVALGVRGYPQEIRRAIAAGAETRRPELAAAFAGFTEARRRMYEAMRAEPFDRAALDATFAEVRAKTAALQEVGQQIIGEAVAGAPPEARARIRVPRAVLR